jgi:hypothetical protein
MNYQEEFAYTIRSDLTSHFARVALTSGPPMMVDVTNPAVAQAMREVAEENPGDEVHEDWRRGWAFLEWWDKRPAFVGVRDRLVCEGGDQSWVPELTDDELAEYRAWILVNPDTPTTKWTCDECAERHGCGFVFEWYNTDGDCLRAK